MNKIKEFQLEFPDIVHRMKTTTHHYDKFNLNPYHLEGDIWTHTMMVHQHVWDEKLHPNLDDGERELLSWVTLIHDLGKVFTRQTDDEKKKTN